MNGPTSAIAWPGLDEAGHRHALGIGQPPDHADDRRGVDRALRRPRCRATRCRPTTGTPRREAGVAQALHRTGQLPRDVRLLGVAEVEAVGEPERLGAHAGEVAGALEHRLDRCRCTDRRPRAGRCRRSTRRSRRSRRPPVELEHGGVGRLRAAHGARPDDRVVLLEREALGGDVRRAEQGEQGARPDRRPRRGAPADRGRAARPAPRARGRRAGSRPPAPPRACRRPARRRRARAAGRVSVTSPMALARTSQRSQISSSSGSRLGLDHAEHPLLRLGDHDLEGLHVGLAQRHLRHVDVEAHARPSTPSPTSSRRARPRRGPGATRSTPRVEQLEAALEQLLLLEGIADLHASAAWRRPPRIELRAREHRRAADPVAARARAHQHQQVARRPPRRCGSARPRGAMPTHIALTRQFCS